MDGLSAAASIWALAEAAGALIKYFNTAKSASKDMSKIQRELSILHSLLITLINLKFEFENSETSKEWNSAMSTLGVEFGPFAECADTMSQLRKKIASRNGIRAIALWAFIKDDVHEMLDKIERLKTAINLVLSVDQLKLSNLMYTHVKEVGSKLDHNNDRAQVQEALNWISGLNFRAQQARHTSMMERDTGHWFLNSQEFVQWLEQPGQILFCPGIPGAGKTMMAASVVNHVETQLIKSTPGTNLAYLFCDYKSEEEQSLDQLLGNLLQQLIQNSRELAGPLVTLYEAHAEKKTFPSVGEITDLLRDTISRHVDVYIVVDAIDECPQRNRRRRQLLSTLQNLNSDTDALHLFVTSRFTPDVVEVFKDTSTLEVKAHSEDVRRYVQARFEDFKAPLSDSWQTKVEEAIIASTNSMFLFARFLTDRFASLHTLKQVKALLRELAEGPDTPKTTVDVYHDMYRATLKRIDGQAERDKVLARKVLLWLSNAARLLSTQELRSALSIEPEDTEFDVDNLLSMDLIVSVCAGLVIVEEQSEIVRLVHYTAQEYFDSLGHDQRMKEQQELAATCLTYLCFDDFKTRSELESGEVVDEEAELFRMAPGWLVHHDGGIDSSTWGRDAYDSVRSGEVESVQITGRSYTGRDVGAIEHAFVDYAANFWALHAKECQTDILQLVLRLLTDHQLAAHAFHKATALHQRWAFLRTSDDLTSTRTTGLHLVAAIGLAHICRELLKILDNDRNIHADVKDDGGRTALMWAAHHGHVEIVDMLLDREDVRYDRTCSRGDTALNYAARQGKTAVIRSLIDDKKTDSHMIRNSFHSWGDYIQHENVGYRVRRENAFGETAIVQAALEGHDEVVKLLREHDTESIHHEVMFGLWPIHIAAQRRAVSIMELLIDECGVAADIEDPKGYSPFVVAADWNNEQVVRYFLQEKRDVLENKPEMVVQAAKVTAANWKREAILRLIVEEAGSMLGGVHLEELLEVAVSAGNVNMAIYLAAQKAKLSRGESIKATV